MNMFTMLLDSRIRSAMRAVVRRRMSLLVAYTSIFFRWLFRGGLFIVRVLAVNHMRWHKKMSKSADDLYT